MKIKLGVIFGGVSVEHEVSVISAIQAIENIDTMKYDVMPIYISKNGDWYAGEMLKDINIYSDPDLLKRYATKVILYRKENRFVLLNVGGLIKKEFCDLDIVFPVMHGTYGEDGALQGYLETVGIPYAESDHYAATVGQDKIFMKQIWKDSGVPVVNYTWFFDIDFREDPEMIIDKCNKLDFPLIVKPARLGSSVGIGIAHNNQELNDAISEAVKYDTKILVEEMVKNLTEVNISVYGNYRKQKLSVIEEVGGSKEFLTYDDKYKGSSKTKGNASRGMASAKRIIPARISDELKKKVGDIAIKAFRSLNSSGVVRIDFLIDKDTNKVYANEINSIPGSLSFYLWDKTGKEYHELLDDVITVAIRDYKDRINKTHTFDTNILSNYKKGNGTKGVKK